MQRRLRRLVQAVIIANEALVDGTPSREAH
jgi:hypothetical protein